MTDEAWELWYALWQVASPPEQAMLEGLGLKSRRVWLCHCQEAGQPPRFHDWWAIRCWHCQRPHPNGAARG